MSAQSIRDALLRLNAAILDLSAAGCHAEAAELGALTRRLRAQLEHAPVDAAAGARPAARPSPEAHQ